MPEILLERNVSSLSNLTDLRLINSQPGAGRRRPAPELKNFKKRLDKTKCPIILILEIA